MKKIRKHIFEDLSLPLDSDVFIEQLKQRLSSALAALNDTIPHNTKVRISSQNGGRIIVTPLTPQSESTNIGIIKNIYRKNGKELISLT